MEKKKAPGFFEKATAKVKEWIDKLLAAGKYPV